MLQKKLISCYSFLVLYHNGASCLVFLFVLYALHFKVKFQIFLCFLINTFEHISIYTQFSLISIQSATFYEWMEEVNEQVKTRAIRYSTAILSFHNLHVHPCKLCFFVSLVVFCLIYCRPRYCSYFFLISKLQTEIYPAFCRTSKNELYAKKIYD